MAKSVDILEIIARLYEDEINWEVSTFWDTGYYIMLGDKTNGYKTEQGEFDDFKDAIIWLAGQATKIYKDSKFATWWKKVK